MLLLRGCTFIAQTIVTHKYRRNYEYMKSSDAKASKCHLKFSSKMRIFYVQLFQINCIEKDLYIAIRIKLLNLNLAAW